MATFEDYNDPAYLEKLRKQAEAQLAPGRDLQFNQIGLEEQGLNQNQLDINNQYDRVAKLLEEQAKNSQGSLEERQNQLGLLSSGLTAAGLGKIQTDLFTGKKESEQERASRLANLALQRSGLGLKRAEIQQTFSGNVNDLVQKLIQQSMVDQSVSPVDLGDRIAFVDRFGNVKSVQRKGSLSGGGGASSELAQILASVFGGAAKTGGATGAGGILPTLPYNQMSTRDLVMHFKDLGYSAQEIQDAVNSIQNEQIPQIPTIFPKPNLRARVTSNSYKKKR